jgi:cytochrome c556
MGIARHFLPSGRAGREFAASARASAEASDRLASAARSGQTAETTEHLRSVTRARSACHDVFTAKE